MSDNSKRIKLPPIHGIQTVPVTEVNNNVSRYFRMANRERIATRVTGYGRLLAVIIPGPEQTDTQAARSAWKKRVERKRRAPVPDADPAPYVLPSDG